MLQQVTHRNGLVVYRSPILAFAEIPHGFSTRVGGVSGGEFASLNLGNNQNQKDAPANLQENFRRFQETFGAADLPRASVTQVHGRQVELLDVEPEGEYAETLAAEVRDRFAGQISADGLVTVGRGGETGVVLTVRVADCLPILLADPTGRVVAAVHAGWRGVVAGVVERALQVMAEVGAATEGILAAIGPGISVANFEVGAEVAAEFEKANLGAAVQKSARGKGSNPHVDLQAAVRLQLTRAGVTRIDGNDLCTFRDDHLFYSHRRENGRTGRMAAGIAVRT